MGPSSSTLKTQAQLTSLFYHQQVLVFYTSAYNWQNYCGSYKLSCQNPWKTVCWSMITYLHIRRCSCSDLNRQPLFWVKVPLTIHRHHYEQPGGHHNHHQQIRYNSRRHHLLFQMDDFSYPDLINAFGVPPSENNMASDLPPLSCVSAKCFQGCPRQETSLKHESNSCSR